MTDNLPTGLLAQTACLWEATARKVGNVHRYTDFADMTYLDFVLSAASLTEPMTSACHQPIGDTVRSAVEARTLVTPANTNLGIALLLAPLAAVPHGTPLRSGVEDLLSRTTVDDSAAVFEAIRLAKPGGLGSAPKEDVGSAPTMPLVPIMELAAERDMVARQYANRFADVFTFGVPAFLDGFARHRRVEAAVIECQLFWLSEYPDSLIARKCGAAVAEDVRRRAAGVLDRGGLGTDLGRTAGVSLDRHLRSDGSRLNPGTTADLVTACLFVALRENKVSLRDPFSWNVPNWL